MKRILLSLIVLLIWQNVSAQLSTTHYLPPVFSSEESTSDGLRRQAIYLSTPNATPIDVLIQSADGVTLNTTITISNTSEGIFDLNAYYGDNNLANNNTFVGVRQDKLNQALTNEGLFFTSSEPFLVSYRAASSAQGDILSTKGEFAIGTEFKLGALPLPTDDLNSVRRNIFASFIALEDDTDITVDGYDPNLLFRMADGTYQTIPPPMIFSLDARESYVFAADRNGNAITGLNVNTINSLVGASITSNNPIVMNSGNLTLSGIAASASGSRDFGLDQSVPLQYLGNRYAFIKGNSTGSNINRFERPLIIATADNTDISINGVYNTTLQNGEYLDVPGSNYSSDGTMLIETTNRVYAYQSLSGNNAASGMGMNFIPPLNCYLQREVDFIPSINRLHPNVTITPFINIITYAGSTVTITQNGGTPTNIPTSNAMPIPSTTDWVAYSLGGYSGNVKVESTGPSMISLFGQSGVIGASGYFSGFGGNPQIEITTITGGIDDCYNILSIAELPDNTTNYFWVRSSDNQIVSTDTAFAPVDCGNYELHVFNGTCSDIITTTVDCIPVCSECSVSHPNYIDSDLDGVADPCDSDDDNDGILDQDERVCLEPNYTRYAGDIGSPYTYTDYLNFIAGSPTPTNTDNVPIATFASGDNIETDFTFTSWSGEMFIPVTANYTFSTTSDDWSFFVVNGTLVVDNPGAHAAETQSGNITLTQGWHTFELAHGELGGVASISISHDPAISFLASSACLTADFDGDGIINVLDLDSDNDGCIDAEEGGGSFTILGGDISNDRLIGSVDAAGIPIVAGSSGQGLGSAQDVSVKACDCPNALGVDSDGDGLDDVCDLDDDNDGILDTEECPIINYALAGTATQSSHWGGALVISNLNDGNTGAPEAHTGGGSSTEWMQIDLGAEVQIDELVIWNRTACCRERLSNMYIMFSNDPFPNNTNLAESLSNANYIDQVGDASSVDRLNISIGHTARYIRLQKSGINPGGNWINLYEVQALEYTDCNTDGDALTNLLDNDSDEDGCFDAIEGAGSFIDSDTDAGGALTGGIDANGIPTVTSGGQGTTADVTDASTAKQCNFCTRIIRTNRHISRTISRS